MLLRWPPLSRARAYLALGVDCAVAVATGCTREVEGDRAPSPPVVSVVEARRATVPIMAEPIGTTTALQEVSIRARVRGHLNEIHFKEGADVKQEQLLFVIDKAPFKAQLAAARAKLEQAEAALKKAQDSKAREVATAQLTLSQAMLELAEVEERREKSLYSRKASSQEDVQRKQAIRKKDAAHVEADKASLDRAKADHETSLLAARADVSGARAQVTSAEIDLGYCRLFSPIDGRIGLAQVKIGNLVGPTTSGGGADYTEFAVIRQIDPIGIDIQVASRYLDRVTQLIAQGLPVEVYRPGLQGEEGRRYSGKATVVDNTIDPATSTFRVQAEVPNPQKSLLPGEYVRADVKVGEARDVVVVPEQAVIESQAGPLVYAVNDQGKVVVAMVSATFIHQGRRDLESGIQPGQKIDRIKARRLDVAVSDAFGVLQTNLGPYYVNDFNLYGKTWKVIVQAEARDRCQPDAVARLYVLNHKGGQDAPERAREVRYTLGPIDVPHYNMYTAARITGQPTPGYSSGQAIAAMEAVPPRSCRKGSATSGPARPGAEGRQHGDVHLLLMTSFVFGVLPMGRATGAGAYCRNSQGVVIASGIAVSTILGRFVNPIYHVLGERLRACDAGATSAPRALAAHENGFHPQPFAGGPAGVDALQP